VPSARLLLSKEVAADRHRLRIVAQPGMPLRKPGEHAAERRVVQQYSDLIGEIIEQIHG